MAYVASSHVLEHIANPVAAICEWYRVLRHGSIMYMVIPDRRYTWDRYRKLTFCEHMLDDYIKGVTDSDAMHIDEFVDTVDWSEYDPSAAPEDVPAKKHERKKIYPSAVNAGKLSIFIFMF